MTVPLNGPDVVYACLPCATREEVEEVAQRWIDDPHDAYNLGDGTFTKEEVALALAQALTEYIQQVCDELEWHFSHNSSLGNLFEHTLERAAHPATPGIPHGPTAPTRREQTP